MKRFILSAALALACFTAQAKNEIIKNDDDKNPKTKAKVVKEVPTQVPCTKVSIGSYECPNGSIVVGFGISTSSSCTAAAKAAKLRALADAIEICG